MDVELERSEDGGITLRVKAKSDLEAIALEAWLAQKVKNARNVDVMPTRHIVIALPAVSF